MADQKLTYKVDVDTGSAVRDLDKLGQAGEDAGKQIAQGFDQAESKSKSAIQALTAQLDKVESEAKAAAEAVSAIKANLTVDVDDSKIAQFASDIRSKMGLTFDEITADAKQFADVLERGVNMDRTRGEIRGVGDELEHVRSESDQSRSVLANLAGNAAQDLGELGGVVGTLGVGVGQLAEYAVDGNIALSNLAKVAGPMAALTAVSLALNSVITGFRERAAAAEEHQKKLNELFREGGDVVGNYGDMIAEVGTTSTDSQASLADVGSEILGIGTNVQDVSDLLDMAGLSFREFSRGVTQGGEDLRATQDQFDLALDQGRITEDQWRDLTSALAEARTAWTDTGDEVAKANRLMVLSSEDVNDALRALEIKDDPLAVLSDGIIEMGDVTVDSALAWRQLVDDLRDGKADLGATGGLVSAFASAMGISTDEVIELAQAEGKATTFTKAFGEASVDAAESVKKVGDNVDDAGKSVAAIGQILDSTDWGAASIDATSSAMGGFFDTFTAGRDAVAGVQGALDDLETAFDEQDGLLPNLSTPEGRATFAALEQLGTALIPGIQRAFDQSNGSVAKFKTGMTALYQDTLAQLSDQLNISEDDAKALLAQIGLTPDNFSTQYELIGDELAMQQLTLLQGVIQGLPRDVQAKITYQISTGNYQGAVQTIVNYGASHPVVQPSKVNTSGAQGDIDKFRRGEESDPLDITVRPLWSSLWSSGPPIASTRFVAAAAPRSSGFAAVTAMTAVDDDGEAPELAAASVAPSNVWMPTSAAAVTQQARPLTINVNVSAGVIGNRFDVERAVLRAVRSGTRLRGAGALVAP